jgi:G3E family GTPase
MSFTAMSITAVTPVVLLTGFLGSGKTTLLKRILSESNSDAHSTAVIVNELGEIGLDQALLGSVVRESNEQIVVMPNGCICCSVAADLVRVL